MVCGTTGPPTDVRSLPMTSDESVSMPGPVSGFDRLTFREKTTLPPTVFRISPIQPPRQPWTTRFPWITLSLIGKLRKSATEVLRTPPPFETRLPPTVIWPIWSARGWLATMLPPTVSGPSVPSPPGEFQPRPRTAPLPTLTFPATWISPWSHISEPWSFRLAPFASFRLPLIHTVAPKAILQVPWTVKLLYVPPAIVPFEQVPAFGPAARATPGDASASSPTKAARIPSLRMQAPPVVGPDDPVLRPVGGKRVRLHDPREHRGESDGRASHRRSNHRSPGA